MLDKVWDFLKRSWEWIAFGVGIILAYVVYMDPDKVEDFDYRDGKLEGKAEAEQEHRTRARKKKTQAEENLDKLREEEKKLEDKLQEDPRHKDKTKEELRKWMQKNYG
jgi:hypothetical protein